MMYEHAIDNARYHESGLDLVEPHSLMRLAQMYLPQIKSLLCRLAD